MDTSTPTAVRSDDGQVTLDFPAGSRDGPFGVSVHAEEDEESCSSEGAASGLDLPCVTVDLFDAEGNAETDVQLDAPAALTFQLAPEQVAEVGGAPLLTDLHEKGGLPVLTRPSVTEEWAEIPSALLLDESGGAALTAPVITLATFTVIVVREVLVLVREESAVVPTPTTPPAAAPVATPTPTPTATPTPEAAPAGSSGPPVVLLGIAALAVALASAGAFCIICAITRRRRKTKDEKDVEETAEDAAGDSLDDAAEESAAEEETTEEDGAEEDVAGDSGANAEENSEE